MGTKEALLAVRSLLQVLVRERRLRAASAPRDVVLHESETWLALLSVVEGFIRDDRIIGTIQQAGVEPDKVARHARHTRDWITYWHTLAQRDTAGDTLTQAEYQRFTHYTDMLLTRTTNTLDDLLNSESSLERAEKPYAADHAGPRKLNFLTYAAATLLFALTGCGNTTGNNALYAQETPTQVTVQNTNPREQPDTTEQKREYVKELEERIQKIPIEEGKPWHFYNNKAVELAHAGRYDEAIRFSKKAIELAPDKDQPYTNVASAYCAKGESLPSGQEEARQYWVKALEYAKKGLDIFNAKKLATLSKEQAAPLLCVKYQWLGNIYLRLGDSNEARRYLDLALTNDDSPAARKLLAELNRPH